VTKICKVCKQEKDLSVFYSRVRAGGRTDYYGECIACNRQRRGRPALEQRVRFVVERTATHKKCNQCKQMLSYGSFWETHGVRSKDGHQGKCKKCAVLWGRKHGATDHGRKVKAASDKRWRANLIVGSLVWWKKKYYYSRYRNNYLYQCSWVELMRMYMKNPFCSYCKVSLQPNEIHFDHKMPRSRGGGSGVENLCVTCAPCNRLKWNQTDEEFKQFLLVYTSRIAELTKLKLVQKQEEKTSV